jgi:hypothetical protein
MSILNLTFDAATHTYRFEGKVIPSVTQCLKTAGIIDYSMIPQDILRRAAARGTAVHRACELYDLDTLDESTLDAEVGGYLEGYKKFLRDTRFQPSRIEQRCYHEKFRYAGTLDRTGILKGQLVLLDFKTGIVLEGHRAQLAAYTMTFPMPRRYRRIGLQLKGEGDYKIHEFPIRDLALDFNTFLGALHHTQKQLNTTQEGQAA